jgi:hypothetical protein
VRGEIIAGPGEFEIEVLDADPRRVKRLRVGRRPKELSKRETRKRPNEEGNPARSQSGTAQETFVSGSQSADRLKS